MDHGALRTAKRYQLAATGNVTRVTTDPSGPVLKPKEWRSPLCGRIDCKQRWMRRCSLYDS